MANVFVSPEQLFLSLLRMFFVHSENPPLGDLDLSDEQGNTPSQDYLSGRMAWPDDKSIALSQFQHLAT